MRLKLDDNGAAVLVEGKPVYVGDDGKETAFDVAGTIATIRRLNAEAKGHREAKEAAEAALKAYEGIDDADAARKAIETVRNLDAKKLVDAGEVDKIRAEAIKAVEDKYAPVVKERDRLNAQLVAEVVGGNFARSKFIHEKLAIPPDLVQAKFGQQFKVEGAGVVAYDAAGNKIYSRANPGEVASFDEALSMIVDSYAHRDTIMKSTGGSGAGSAGAGTAKGGAKVKTRAEFDALGPMAKADFMRSGGSLQD